MYEGLDPIKVEECKKALYEVAKMPGFDVVLAIIQQPMMEYRSGLPLKPDDEVAFKTASYVCFTVQDILARLRTEIGEGEQLTRLEEAGDTRDVEESRSGGEQRRRA